MNNTTTILKNTQNIYSIAPSMGRHAPLAAATHDAAQRFEKLAQRILARHSHGGTEMGLLREPSLGERPSQFNKKRRKTNRPPMRPITGKTT